MPPLAQAATSVVKVGSGSTSSQLKISRGRAQVDINNGGFLFTDHIGWRLQAQTNSVPAGLGTNWFDVPNSTATNQMAFTLDPGVGSVFYRLVYP